MLTFLFGLSGGEKRNILNLHLIFSACGSNRAGTEWYNSRDAKYFHGQARVRSAGDSNFPTFRRDCSPTSLLELPPRNLHTCLKLSKHDSMQIGINDNFVQQPDCDSLFIIVCSQDAPLTRLPVAGWWCTVMRMESPDCPELLYCCLRKWH
jgi:hypothetical protein